MKPRIAAVLLLLPLGLWLAWEVYLQLVMSGVRIRGAPDALRTLVSAQDDFRYRDRDGDGTKAYWRKDVAGLYALKPKGSSEPIKLIELSIAGADAAAVEDTSPYAVRAPKAGYWFKALPFAGEGSHVDPQRFAYCAWPESLAVGREMYLVTHEKALFRKRIERIDPPDTCPADPLKEGWVRVP
jgi:hypothetical protein